MIELPNDGGRPSETSAEVSSEVSSEPPARREANQRFVMKDYLGVVLSSFALLISASTAYFNVIREVDDLQLVSEDFPRLTVRDSLVHLDPTITLTLVNLGNRPVAITNIDFGIQQPSGDAETCGKEIHWTGYGVDPIIIQAGEIKVLKPERQRDSVVSLESFNEGKQAFKANVCGAFHIVTPKDHRRVTILLGGGTVNVNMAYAVATGTNTMRQQVLFYRWGTVFSH